MPSPYWPAPSRTSSYIPTPPPARRLVPTPPARRPITAANAPIPPDFRALLEQLLSAEPAERTEQEWNTTLAPRLQPFIDSASRARDFQRGRSESLFETQAEANKGLSAAMLGIATGGKTGAEAEQFAREQFGGSQLPAQIAYMADQRLRELTHDFGERDWEITGAFVERMDKIPGLREQMRADIEDEETSDYDRRVKTAGLLIDESHRYFAENRAVFESEQGRADAQAVTREQLKIAARASGLRGYMDRKDAVSEMRSMSAQTGTIWTVKRADDRTWVAVDTGKKKAGAAKAPSAALRNSALREASDMTKGTGNVWRVRNENGQWVAYDSGKKKAASSSASAGLSEAMKTERDLAVSVLTEHRDEIMGKPSASGIRSKGKTYQEAYDYIYGIAEAALSPYSRGSAYIDKWVKLRLKALFPTQKPGAKRSGP